MRIPRYSHVVRVLGAAVLFVFATFSVCAHQVDPATASPAALAAGAVTGTGTVAELVVDNQVANVTLRYLALRLDDGQTVVLTGAGLEALADGARVDVSGTLSGEVLEVTGFSVLPAAQAAAKASGRKQVQGTLVVWHKDYFAEGRGEYGLGVHDGAAQITPLNVAVVPDALRPGMTVSVSGTTAPDGVTLDTNQITILAMPPAQAQPLGVTTTNNVLVLPIKFSDSPAADPFTPAQVDQVMRTNTLSTTAYYNEVSYGQQALNVTVACQTTKPAGCAAHTSSGGWLQSSSATPPSCDYTTIASLADAAATAAGYTVANYINRFYVLPSIAACGWAGLAYVGYPYQAWSNGVNALWVYGHELGHNFSLYHAGSVSCGSLVLSVGCSVAEYGDRFDVMGNNSVAGQQMHFNATQKALLGWIPASAVATQTSGTKTYSLSPLEAGGQSLYAVKIPVAADTNRTYWIEYRQPIGLFDATLSNYPNLGAIIHVAEPFDNPCTGNCFADDTEILDMSPSNGDNFYDAALLVGQTYTDSTYGVSITVNSATASALSVTVSMGGEAATTTTLASSGNPSTVGASVTFTATVTGSAPTGSVSFTADGTALSGCAAVALTGSGNTRTAACSTASLAVGTHSIVASYTGDAANTGSTSATLSQVVNNVTSSPSPAGTTVPPAASITDNSGGVWTLGTQSVAGGYAVLRNGVQAAGGGAVKILWSGTQITVLNNAGNTYLWTGSSWALQPKTTTPSATTLASSANPSLVGASVTFTATVTGSAPTGSVSFTADGATLSCGAVALPAGSVNSKTATCSTASLAAGTQSIVASYSGDAVNTGSTSATLSQAVDKVTSATGVTTSVTPSTVNTNVTFTATVTGSAPTGSVSFTADGATLSGCTAVALTGSGNTGTAACSTASLAVGTHGIVASYTGDAANTSSTSATLSQVVNNVTSSPSPAGTTVPPAASITDNSGGVWTLGTQTVAGGYAALLNGVQAAGGGAVKILWSGTQITVLNNAGNTYLWTGSSWALQPRSSESPAGTTVPPAASITDNSGGVWTLGAQTVSGGYAVLLNGVQAAGGGAVKILWSGTQITVLNNAGNTYLWTGSSWTRQ